MKGAEGYRKTRRDHKSQKSPSMHACLPPSYSGLVSVRLSVCERQAPSTRSSLGLGGHTVAAEGNNRLTNAGKQQKPTGEASRPPPQTTAELKQE